MWSYFLLLFIARGVLKLSNRRGVLKLELAHILSAPAVIAHYTAKREKERSIVQNKNRDETAAAKV